MAHMEESRIRRIETLIAGMEAIPDVAIRTDFRQLVEAVLELHGSGLRRMIEIVQASGEQGRLAVSHLAAEPLVSSLLILHGIHPDNVETRARKAVARLRGAELTGVEEDIVHVRLAAGESADAAFELLRDAVLDVSDIVIEEAPAAAGFVPLSSIVMAAVKEG